MARRVEAAAVHPRSVPRRLAAAPYLVHHRCGLGLLCDLCNVLRVLMVLLIATGVDQSPRFPRLPPALTTPDRA